MFDPGPAPHRIPVLRYAQVGGPSAEGPGVSWEAFSEHLSLIAASGRRAVTLTHLAQLLRRRRTPEHAVLAVTIDDESPRGLDAARRLVAREITLTAFVNPGTVGTPERLSDAQLRELVTLGERVQIGLQPGPDPLLDELPEARAREAIIATRGHLEAMTERTVESIAYPGGAYDAGVRAAARGAGLTAGAALKDALSHPGDDPWAIARYTVTPDTEPADIEALLHGRGAPLAWSRDRLGARLGRRSRRLRRRVRRGAP